MIGRILLSLALGLMLAETAIASSVNYAKIKTAGTVAHVVTANLADPQVRVTVALAKGGIGRDESFQSMMNRTRPAAAITGTFFCTKSLIPTGDIKVFGTTVHKGVVGSAICIDSQNHASIVPLWNKNKSKSTDCETVLCAGPTLVKNGAIAIALKHEGFRPGILASTRRTAVGISKSGKLIMVTVNRSISLYKLAKVLINLSVTDAVCLDGGSSTALYANGGYRATPTRTLTNCLVVYSTEAKYVAAKNALVPEATLANAAPVAPNPLVSILPTISPIYALLMQSVGLPR